MPFGGVENGAWCIAVARSAGWDWGPLREWNGGVALVRRNVMAGMVLHNVVCLDTFFISTGALQCGKFTGVVSL